MSNATTTKKSALEVRILALNLLHEYAAKCVEYEHAHFSQFIGKDIFKADGSIKAKYAHEKLTFEGHTEDGTYFNVHYWFVARHGVMDMHIKICVNGGTYEEKNYFCQYQSTQTELFVFNDGGLAESKREKNDYSKRFKIEEITEAAKQIEIAAAAYRAAVNKLPYEFHDILYIERLTR